ncbi:hypothetical protein AgCh_027969 [Apium graveolens]
MLKLNTLELNDNTIQFFGDFKPWGTETAKNAYAKLAEDANAQLVDIRTLADWRQVGGFLEEAGSEIQGTGEYHIVYITQNLNQKDWEGMPTLYFPRWSWWKSENPGL